MAAVVSQRDDEGKDRPMHFASKLCRMEVDGGGGGGCLEDGGEAKPVPVMWWAQEPGCGQQVDGREPGCGDEAPPWR